MQNLRALSKTLATATRVSPGSLQVRSLCTMGKELLNEPGKVVHELLEGLVASVEHLNRLDGFPEVLAISLLSIAARDTMFIMQALQLAELDLAPKICC